MKTRMGHRRRHEAGQVTIFVVMALGIFLLAFTGFATDYTNFWFHRQSVQGGADATCQAAAVDLYLIAVGTPSPNMNFTPTLNGSVDCSTSPTAAPCVIAKYNGFDGALASNKVVMSFPASPPGAPPPPDGVTVPFVQVDVTEKVPAYFSRLLTGTGQVPVHATASCGLTSSPGPVPIIVLHPTDPATIDMRGAPSLIQVVGGPQQSIQVNSQNQSAVTTGSLSTVDLTRGGPDGTGSSFGTFGGQATKPGSVNLGTTGKWLYPHLPISDPYKDVPYPSQPSPPIGGVTGVHVNGTVDGCPTKGTGCTEYRPGYYPGGIQVKGNTAIFVPGLYYLGGIGLNLDSNSLVRVAVGAGIPGDDGSGGVTFYFSGDRKTSVNIDANSGKNNNDHTVCTSAAQTNCTVQYHKDGSTEFGVQSRALKCPGGVDPPAEVPATIPGNVLLAPCTGTYADPAGNNRGFLYFQDRAIAVDGSTGNGVPSWQGGGSTLAAGFMYFHQCHADHTGTEPCDTTAFGDVFHMGGTPGSGSYAVGSLVTDKIYENGNPGLVMILDPDKTFPQYKIVFFQ